MLNPQLTQHIVNFDSTNAAGDAISKSSSDPVSTAEKNHERSSADDASVGIDTPGPPLLEIRTDLLSVFSFLLVILFLVSDKHSPFLSFGFGLIVGIVWQPKLISFRHVHMMLFPRRTLKQRKDWGEKISALLGSVGAPLIYQTLDFSELNMSDEQLKFLTRFVRSQVELIMQLNNCIDLVRRGTSLIFGVSSAHAGIERVEKAALLRWSKHSNDLVHMPCRMPVSLPTLRKRIDDILERQIEGLLKVSDRARIVEQHSKTDVITLSLLSSKKAYALELLAAVVDKIPSLDDNMYKAMEHCVHEAERSRKYISAAATHVGLICSTSTSSASPDKSSVPALHLLDKLESLRIALLTYHENTRNESQVDVGDYPTGWETVEKLAQNFGEAFERTTRKLKQEGKSSDVSRFHSDDSRDGALQHGGSCEVDVSYNTPTEDCPAVHLHAELGDESEMLNKTLIFSGVSARRKGRSKNRPKETRCVSCSGSLPSQMELVDELNERLRSLPPIDELNVRNGAVVTRDDDESKIPAACAIAEVRDRRFSAARRVAEAIDSGGAPSNLSSSFLGELQDSVATSLAGRIVGQEFHEDNEWELEMYK